MHYYPYTHHFPKPDRIKKIFEDAVRITDGKFEFTADVPVIHEESVKRLRSVLNEIADLSLSANYVATFALGGVFPLNYITGKLLQDGKLGANPHLKFHLFAGLDWRAKRYNVSARFLNWLDSLPDKSHVLVFDTGRVGNAAGRIFNLITDYYRAGKPQRNLSITIVVVAHESHIEEHGVTRIVSIPTRKELVCSTGLLRVPRNDFEDVVSLMGYDSLRDQGRIEALRALGSFRVEFEDGSVSSVSSADKAGGFMALIRGDGILGLSSLKSMGKLGLIGTTSSRPDVRDLESNGENAI